MKAKDYVVKYHEYLANPPNDIWSGKPDNAVDTANPPLDAMMAICRDLMLESKELIEKRKAASGAAIEACVREQNQKWLAIVRLLPNEPLIEGLFKWLVMDKCPEARHLISKWPGTVPPGLINALNT